MLLGNMEVGVGNLGGEHKPVMLQAAGFSQLLKFLGTKHFAQSVRRVDGAVDDDVSHMNALRRKFCI